MSWRSLRCTYRYTANSAAVHGTLVFREVLLLWVSKEATTAYQSGINEVIRLASSTGIRATFVDLQPLVVRAAFAKGGWEGMPNPSSPHVI